MTLLRTHDLFVDFFNTQVLFSAHCVQPVAELIERTVVHDVILHAVRTVELAILLVPDPLKEFSCCDLEAGLP